MFKLLGALVGFLTLGLFGGVLGFIFGGTMDRVRAFGRGGFNPFTQAQRQAIFLKTVFILKGKMAKADGHISQAEIDHTESFIRHLGMRGDHRQEAIDWFKQGAAADFDITDTLNEFNVQCGHTRNLSQVMLVYLIVIAMADGVLDGTEERLLQEIAQRLGFNETEYRRILDMTLNQSHFGGGYSGAAGAGASSASVLDDAYKALGVSKDCSDQELKRAYRKLMSQYHPDKLMGQGMPEEMIKVATEQSQEVQTAYDLIRKSRG